MKRLMATASLIGAVTFISIVGAQMGPDMMEGRGGGAGQPPMQGMMHDMSEMMRDMSRHMSKGALSPEQQKQMAAHMKEMAGMMQNMSGMMGKGMMTDPDMQKRMEQMHQRMRELRAQETAPK